LHLIGGFTIPGTIAEIREQPVSTRAQQRYSGGEEIVRRAHAPRDGRKRSLQ
jgi:hypothetical protein